MARLPEPGGDAGNWGEILNDFLRQEHSPDGTHNLDAMGAATAANVSALDGRVETAEARLEANVAAVAALDARLNLSLIEDLSYPLDDFFDPSHWAPGSGGSVVSDTSDAAHPDAAIFITSAGSFTDFVWLTTVNLRNRFLSFWVHAQKVDLNAIAIALSSGGTNFNSRFEGTVWFNAHGAAANGWHLVTVPMSRLVRNGSPVPTAASLSDIRAIRIRVAGTASAATAVKIADLRAHHDPIGGCVCWQFDDGSISQYTEAFPVLADHGYTGAIAVDFTKVGDAGFMTLANLQELASAGWEMNAHGNGLNQSDAAAARTGLRAAQDWLLNSGFGPNGARHYVFPGGVYNEMTWTEARRIYRTTRRASIQAVSAPLVTDGLLQPYYLTGGVSLASAKSALSRIADSGGVLLVAAHLLVTSTSATEDWLISDFEALVAHVKSLGLPSYTPSQLWP